MTKNKLNLSIFLALCLSTMVLLTTVLIQNAEAAENMEITVKLNQEIEQLKKENAAHLAYRQEEAKRMEFQHFKENVFQLRFPRYSKIAEVVFRKSREYSFNPYLVMAIIQVESGFDQYAVSTAGAYGLMQVNFSVWKDELNIDIRRIYEREYNIDLGLRVLRHYYKKSRGNMLLALFRYNNGYKYNNTDYNGKIIATNFYANKHKAPKAEQTQIN